MAPASSITITRSLESAVKTPPSETNQVKARSRALRLEKENNHQCQANNIVNVMSAPGVGANYHYYFVDHSQLGSSSGGGSNSSIKSNKNKVCQAILDAPNADGANQAKRSGSGGVDELEHCSGRPRRTHNRRQHHNQEPSLVDEHENNMTRPRESHSLRPDFIAGPSLSLASSFSSSTSTTTTTSSSATTAAATSRKQPKISERKSSTNNIIINNYEHSSRQALVNSNNSNQMKRQQQLESGVGPESKAASLPAARLFSSLPLCLVLFALSLFSSTTTTLVNGIKLQPEGKEKFYWSGEQFVITCQNNNNIKNVKIRWTGPDNSIITENRKERIHVESNGHRLVVNNTQLVHDDGVYACTINEGPRIRESADFTLKVLKETNFKSTAKHVTLKAGSRGQVDCHVDFDQSVTTASVTWFKNQQPVDLLNDSSIRVQEYDPGRQVSSLIFVPVKREHDDEYTCQATAVTPNLSKIIDYKIRVETQFGPTFDSAEEIIWVESIQAINSRLHNSIGGGLGQHTTTGATSSHHQYQHQQQQQQQQSTATIPHRNMFGANNQRNRGGRLRPGSAGQDLGGSEQQTTTTAGGSGPHPVGEQVVRVELKCSCQANPDANILWFASSNQNFAINKGSPEQVVEDPIQVRSGHNVTSTLVVAYNLDPNWERRREKYKCSASNLLATAEKYYTIEQGNPPPAFLVGPHRSYSPETTVLNFTLLGPVGSSSGGTGGGGEPKEAIVGSLASITPPVDSFRIRAESGPAPTGLGATTTLIAGGSGGHQLQHQHQAHLLTDQQAAELRSIGHARRQTDQTVQWAYSLGPDVNLPLNMSVKLGNLPSGVQRLFLEAHNAVGYSPNSTYLGEFNLVSSGFSSAALNNLSGQNLFVLLASQLVLLASYLMIAPHS